MESAEGWRSILENWPDSIPKKGIVVTSFQETVPFKNFFAFERDRLV